MLAVAEPMNWREFGRKRSWHNSRYCPGIYLELLRHITKTSVRIVYIPAGNGTRLLPKKNQN
jgi:hypothetical protein